MHIIKKSNTGGRSPLSPTCLLIELGQGGGGEHNSSFSFIPALCCRDGCSIEVLKRVRVRVRVTQLYPPARAVEL